METEHNISQELLETIERYLKHTMEPDELATFKTKLEKDPVLKNQVDDTAMIFSGIKKAVLKNKLDVLHSDLTENKAPNKGKTKVFKLNFKSLSIAASILILFGSFWVFNQQPSNEKLFEHYFEPDRGLETTMSQTDNYQFNDAMVDYKNLKYDLAIEKWEILLKNKPENDTLNYFLGSAYLANNKDIKAIDYFKKVVVNQQSSFTQDAYYYLGLAYLQGNNTEAAIEYFKKNNSPKSNEIISELSD
ncbi:tetratricopeptide repeat protein [Cellulophaga tyrosinoxydans]|uniref:Tetratricopeptide repeat-containing protein n=1 Tax=Cellulophaga tyrosinoxydans TaxID=504486 RepID=A0A1W1YZW9_9FLAO|nr:tetratricopeptide repeat protein [Cellulophaga tyrosinoxydans]SMC41676.1 Tetratricopeptide repeat-containing protein [Cellulophaga tyrosinoxydans]